MTRSYALLGQAIRSALRGDWESAVELNRRRLINIAALSRPCLRELVKKAARRYNQVLKIDKYDTIATKNLKLLPHQKNNLRDVSLAQEDFIELPGITKSTLLIKVASRDVLLSLVCKQILTLIPKTHLVRVMTQDNTCIGYLPDDLSLKLKGLLKSGYTYSACLKGASDNTATIFIRELKRPHRPSASPTFTRGHFARKSK